ncbi:MAG: hypothetical protein DCC75_05210 [Proteobacteria bacterium]|nr:MAG: hypothetical protein DCC75_05210 [Pseudomonadota bacterium]
MLTKSQIISLMEELDEALAARGEVGEILIVGGAVMCLVYNARDATKDVDAVFEPAAIMRKLAAEIAERHNLPADWLNDAAKGFLLPNFERHTVLDLPHLRIMAPEPRYILAMKCLSARWDSSDRDDVAFLVRLLKLKETNAVFKIIEKYYPKNRIPPKTQFFIEELFEQKK